MAATSIFFSGRLISIPGSYSEVDASGLATVGPSATGIVALVGTAIGGKPYTAIGNDDVPGDLQTARSPNQPGQWFRSGDLREAAPFAFEPSVDPDIPGGAVAVVFVKANPATQSTATLSNTDGPAQDLTSKDYGYHTRQIKITVSTGTNKGKKYTIVFEGTTEELDDLGGDVMFKVKYLATTPADGFTTATLTVTASAVYASFTFAHLGLDADITTPVVPGAGFELLSSSGADTQVVTVYGLNVTNVAQKEDLIVSGTGVVSSTKLWNMIHGASISAAPTGTITIRKPSAGATITTLTSVYLTRGLHVMSCADVAGVVLAMVADGASTARVSVWGLSASGSSQGEAVQLSGTAPVASTGTWSRMLTVGLGELAAARTVTISAKSINCPVTGYNTLQKCADKFNATPGWTWTQVSGRTTFDPADLDIASATNCLSPAEPSFYANLFLINEGINAKSQFIEAAKHTSATGAPSNVANIYLAGGNEGSSTPGQEATPTAATGDWQACLDLLKKVYVNSVVALTPDPVIHAQLRAHLAYCCGAGRLERDGFVGLMDAGMTTVPTKTEAKAQIVNLNTRHIRAWAQAIDRYNTAGDRETFSPVFGAVALAGMQAGGGIGLPLTHKYLNTLKLSQDSSWNPVDDAEELIQAGLVFGETITGIGRRVVRNVTAHLTTSNIAYVEGSVNQAVNYAVYNYRTQLETAVGKKGFSGTLTAAYGEGKGILASLVGVALITWRALMMSLTLDVIESSVEIAPVLPVNFVKSTVHLVTVTQSVGA